MPAREPSLPGSGWIARSLWRLLLRRRRALFLALAFLGLLALPGLFLLETDNSPEVFFIRDAEALATYRDFRETFGSDRMVRLVASGEAVFSEPGLLWLEELEDGVAALEGVVSVSGVYGRYSLLGWPPYDLEGFRERLRASPYDRSLGWVAGGRPAVSALVLLDDSPPEGRRRLFAELRALLAGAPPGVETRLAGMPVLDAALDRSSREIEQRYFPLLVVFAVVILTLVFRDLAGILLPLGFVAGCELWLLAPMGYLGIELNMILAVLPPLIFVIALATALHLLLYDRALRAAGRPPAAACLETYRAKGWAVLWTGVSTIVGFLSLAASPVAPVRSLGLWAPFGLAVMTLLAFTLYPATLVASGSRGLPPRLGRFERRARELGRRWARLAGRQRGRVLAVTVVFMIVALAGLPQIRIESNALHYLSEEHPVRRDVESLEREGMGLAAVELVLSLPAAGEAGFTAPAELSRLAALTDRLEAEPLVLGASSLGNLVGDAVRRMSVRPTGDLDTLRELVVQGLELDPEGRRRLRTLVSGDRRTARLTLFVRTVGYERLGPLIERARAAAQRDFPEARIEVTGQFPLLVEVQRHLVSTLVISLSITLAVIAVIFRLLLPGTRFTLLALLPNLWPVVSVLGLMGWLGVPLDVATVMVASIALGLAVDDTIHTLGHFRRLAPLHGGREAVVRTLEQTAPAYLLTGLVLGAGFAVCGLSDFAPTARFGLLSAAAIGFAVLGDLFLLPALLSLTPRRTVRRMGSGPPGGGASPGGGR